MRHWLRQHRETAIVGKKRKNIASHLISTHTLYAINFSRIAFTSEVSKSPYSADQMCKRSLIITVVSYARCQTKLAN